MQLRKTRIAGLLNPAVAAVVTMCAMTTGVHAQDPGGGGAPAVQTLAPDTSLPQAVRLSLAEKERLFEIKERIREQTAQTGGVVAAGPAGLAQPVVRASDVLEAPDAARYPGVPSLFIMQNFKNPRANGIDGSTLAEPAAINEGRYVYAAGNFDHTELSPDGGITWLNVAVPGGPVDAPIACCDNDIVYNKARGVTFHSLLYINNTASNGVVRIFVRRNLKNLGDGCSYTIDQAGSANNILMDYPHLGVSNGFLYLATNDIGPTGQVSRMRRFNIDQMADCTTVSFTTYSWPATIVGQRIFTPGEGATHTMYWAFLNSATQLRIFSWPEAAAAPTNTLRNISSTSFVNPVCRGGVLNNDYADSLWAHPTGFNLRTAVGGGQVHVFWTSGPIGGFTQSHARGARFDQTSLALIAQPIIWNGGFCFGMPMISANARGHIGMALAYGGSNVGGSAANAAVGIFDEYTPNGQFFQTAAGTHNRTDQRFGDYFTVRPQAPCDLFWSATSYALSGGTGVANVNSRYVEFGRNRDTKCFLGWSDKDRTH